MCMMTGKDPGTLGVYGFRNRRDHSYDGLQFASSRLVSEPALWEIIAKSGLQTISLGVPLTYPPRPINGLMITDFLAPDTKSEYTYPPGLKDEIRDVVGEYLFDTRQFRTEQKEQLLADIYTMTAQRFKLAKHLITTKPWDLFVMVEMGPDRIHHGFWKYFDPQHPRHVPSNPFENAIRDYYIALDEHIGRLVDCLEPGVRLLIVSDHGAKRMDGGICFNQWLINEGYLKLIGDPPEITKLEPRMVDWANTRAWGDGGYYGRLFLNVRGREPLGMVAPADLDDLKAELTAKLEQMADPTGKPLGNKVFRPDSIYKSSNNVPPDLIVYFGDLHYRSIGTVGHVGIYVETNDTGPDDANHAQHGIFIMSQGSGVPPPFSLADRSAGEGTRGQGTDSREQGTGMSINGGELQGLSIYDVAPTVLDAFGIAPPSGMGRDRVISIGDNPTGRRDEAYTEEEEEELARRLEELGYL